MFKAKAEIIVLNYNGEEILPLCLPSLVEAAKKASHPTRVTLLDNRSTDESLLWVKNHFPEVRVVVARENRFLVSFNDYVDQSEADVVILMNNDIRVDTDFVDPLVRVFEKEPDAFLACPQSFSFDGSQYEGGRTRARIKWGIFWSSAVFPGYEALRLKPGPTFASGFGAFHRKRFLALGGYDDLYLPGIVEDADLGFRAWREGYRSYYVPESRVYHFGQASFRKAFGKKGILTLAHRNGFLFIWKNLSDRRLLWEHFLFLIPRWIWALLRGKTEFLLGFFQALPRWQEAWKRRKFPVKRARSDREIFRLASGEAIQRRYLFKRRWKRIGMRLFDFWGGVLFSFLSKFRKPSKLDPRKILVVRLDSLGDGVLTLPAIQSLKKRFPEAQIDFLAGPVVRDLYALLFPESEIHFFEKNWFAGSTSLREILRDSLSVVRTLRKVGYDSAFDFRGDLRTILLLWLSGIPHRWGRDGTGGGFLLTQRLDKPYQRHEIFENLELIQGNGALAPVEFPDLSRFQVREKKSSQKEIVIHWGAGYPSKRWAVKNFIEVAKRIQAEKLGIPIFIGTGEEQRLFDPYRNQLEAGFLDFTEKTPLPELLSLLSRADLYIGNDSGPAHLAALLDRKLLLVFSGTNDFRRWAPWSSKLRLLTRPVPCSPCEEKVCPLRRQICLEDISVEEVFHAAEEMLRE